MTKVLTFAIISHERPIFLQRMLESVLSVERWLENSQIIVTDNSTLNQSRINHICNHYPKVHLIQNPGISQSENFKVAINAVKSKFFMLAHDDDFLLLSPQTIAAAVKILDSSNSDKLFVPNSVSFSPRNPFYVYRPSYEIPKPYSMKALPFGLPVFPSWVFPNNDFTKRILIQSINESVLGKYSDIDMIERILENFNYSYQMLPYWYIHIQHDGSDSSRVNLKSRFKLFAHVINKAFHERTIHKLVLYLIKSVAIKVASL
jgi:hypothetical protein